MSKLWLCAPLFSVTACSVPPADDGLPVGDGTGSSTSTPVASSTTDPTTSTAGSTSGTEPGTTQAPPEGTTLWETTSFGDEGVDPDRTIWDLGADLPEVVCTEECVDANVDNTSGSWVLHFGGVGALPPTMDIVDLETGTATRICSLEGDVSPIGGIKSATFTRDNRLILTDGRRIFEVDACGCTFDVVGEVPEEHFQIFGVAPDEGDGLFGVSAVSGALLRIDADTAEVSVVGSLGLEEISNHGLTWSEAEQTLYFINGVDDTLHTVDPQTGLATQLGPLSTPIGTVGIELHPDTNMLYACGLEDQVIHEIDKDTGETTPLRDGPFPCRNLGAPWATGAVVCVPAG